MKIMDFILKSLARTLPLRWQGGLATIIYDVPYDVPVDMTTPATTASEGAQTTRVVR